MNEHDEGRPFRDTSPVAWTFHRNTSRWAHNAATAQDAVLPEGSKEDPGSPYVALPRPTPPDATLWRMLEGRFSCRRYARRAVSLDQLALLLLAGYGVLGRTRFGPLEFLERPVPSGGGLYPLELYPLVRNVDGLDAGVYHYVPVTHGLEQVRDVLVPRALQEYLFMGQPLTTDAAVVIVIAAAVDRLLRKYGDRGYRYILFEAGHVAQNLNLAAGALGLGSCNLGGFFDLELGGLLELDAEAEVPVYAVALGVPEAGNRDALRAIDQAPGT
jgi:SagB-type dehydrogenase family enzyme